MSNCRAKALAHKISLEAVNKNLEVYCNVMKDIDSCAKINTIHYLETSGTASYSRTTVPEDLLNICQSTGCKNTGTLTVNGTQGASAKFSSISDATYYYAGLVYYYVKIENFVAGENGTPVTYKVTTKISDLKDVKQTNSDTYETTLKVSNDGFYPITIDLAKAPKKSEGTGWKASTNGTVISISVSDGSSTQSKPIVAGISSIAFFDGIDKLENNDVVVLGCLDSISGDDSFDTLEQTCKKAQLDNSSVTITKTVSATQYTPNVDLLNPMYEQSDEITGYYMYGRVFTVEKAPDNEEYGYLHIPDAYTDECGFIYASLNDNCNITDAQMRRVNNPNLLALNELQFQVLTTKQNQNLDIVGAELYFSKELIGREVYISYPKTADDVKVAVYKTDGMNDVRFSMNYQKKYSDNTIKVVVYPNVLVTTFPDGYTKDENQLDFEFSVQPDDDGVYVKTYTINKEAQML